MEELIKELENLMVIWNNRANVEDNGTYIGEYFQPRTPSEVCATELKEVILNIKKEK